ncbi:NAD(P)-dependent oxidoreductase [Microbacterium sp. zg.B48]|uniref:NAD(P)-dependent oxidoreductase n=1 Tax=Microbacterium sp. zg.B48 TaxID=2969408 RepID=UPI00214BD6E4|nr:NAD(P)-dependent oxidoreductase [Microbacterium sp. zg.B48]MCR2764023.1 NAD(P)-dependent oxidoreductase [Microbacterium sp. zg.B48]
MDDKTLQVGFVGLGMMGTPMSRNLARAGVGLRVYDADADRTRTVASELGVAGVVDPAELAACDVIVTMLPTSAIVRSVFLNGDGALRIPLRQGTVVVDMSSSDPTETVATGRALAAFGVRLVDAPVSGGVPRAADGTLAIMMGADDEDAAALAERVVEPMSRSVYRTGGLGTGDAMKALNNFVAGAAFAATSEALIAGRQFGLDPQLMIDILNDSTGQSFSSTHVFGPHVVAEKYASGFSLPLITKDIRIARDLQRGMGRDAPVCEAVASSFEDALDALGGVDHTAAHRFWSGETR